MQNSSLRATRRTRRACVALQLSAAARRDHAREGLVGPAAQTFEPFAIGFRALRRRICLVVTLQGGHGICPIRLGTPCDTEVVVTVCLFSFHSSSTSPAYSARS